MNIMHCVPCCGPGAPVHVEEDPAVLAERAEQLRQYLERKENEQNGND